MTLNAQLINSVKFCQLTTILIQLTQSLKYKELRYVTRSYKCYVWRYVYVM